jgi:putative phosphoesterase
VTQAKTFEIGVLSDTHGLVRPEAARALEGCDLLVHAGDIGTPEVLAQLGEIAPTVAVRGNVDSGDWADSLAETELVECGTRSLYLLHDLGELDLDPVAARMDVVISGHSHRPAVSEKAGVLYLNPGSAGPRRFELPVSLARIRVTPRRIRPELITLDV